VTVVCACAKAQSRESNRNMPDLRTTVVRTMVPPFG